MEPQLDQLRSMLQPDGYELAWRETAPNTIELEVRAGDEACADCLVPKAVLAEIANGMLAEQGLRVGSVVYPSAAQDEAPKLLQHQVMAELDPELFSSYRDFRSFPYKERAGGLDL